MYDQTVIIMHKNCISLGKETCYVCSFYNIREKTKRGEKILENAKSHTPHISRFDY